jgi:starch synthase
MKILFIAAEAAPIVRVGGLSDVIGSLPKALKQLGHDVCIIMPEYGLIDSSRYPMTTVFKNLSIKKLQTNNRFSLKFMELDKVTKIYLIDSGMFSKSTIIYDKDELKKFLFFCRAVVEVLPAIDWQPDVVHCHDWHTALIPRWLRGYKNSCGSVFTIHNLAYQGTFNRQFLSNYLPDENWQSRPIGAPEPPFNFMSQGIIWSDILTTVSPVYAKEILTPEYGVGLDSLLRYRREKLTGIVNGIDYDRYNPATDPYIVANYDSATLHRRLVNKLELQRRVGLEENERCPLIGMVSRLDEQKGFDIMIAAIDSLLERTSAQFVILGQGREDYENKLLEVAKTSGRVSVLLTFDEAMAQLIYAGSDIFLMPSKFEPCGLGQLLAFRYGAVPVVRHTGGLVDTVQNITDDLQDGTGFVFEDFHHISLIAAIERAISVFDSKENWIKLVQRIMALDFSWRSSAHKYVTVYREAIKERLYAEN